LGDHTGCEAMRTNVNDDSTGRANGYPVPSGVLEAMKNGGLSVRSPSRGANGQAGGFTVPGTKSANIEQESYFADVVTKVILPMFKKRNQPFVLVFWSRDPDGSQYQQGDSLNQLTPGINGPTSLAAIKNADDVLGKIEAALTELGLASSTNIVVTADHGFSTISTESKTSPSAHVAYRDVLQNHLPPGFLALDIAQDLALPVF